MKENKLILDNDFFKEHYPEDSYLLLKDNLISYSLTVNDIIEYLCSNLLIFPAVRLARNGKYLHEELYTNIVHYKEFQYSQAINIRKAFAYYDDGTSIVISNAHECFYEIKRICYELEQITSRKVSANIYITPPKEKGYGLHFDKHDVFAIQIKGKKRWHLYKASQEKASKETKKDSFEKIETIDLQEGEVIYVPEGLYHDVECLEEHSVHLTLGVYQNNFPNIKNIQWSFVKDAIKEKKFLI